MRMAGDRIIHRLRSRWEQVGIPIERFQERLGISTRHKMPGRLIWFHAHDAVSALSLLNVIDQLNEQELGLNFLVTTRKQEMVSELLDQLPDKTIHQFLPIDLESPVKGFLSYWKPEIAVISDGDFRPLLLMRLAEAKVPAIAVNTKMAEKTYRKWRWLPGMARTTLNGFDLILAQDQNVAQKLRKIGGQSRRIRITGLMVDTKKLLIYDEALYSGLSAAIGNRAVWLAATTGRDEEDVVVNAHKVAMRRNRRLLLILHTYEARRGAPIAARHENQNLTFALDENGDVPKDVTDVYVTDQLENLATYLRLASVTFCGGTLSNGQTIDPFHPASMGSAIIHGPECGSYEQDFERYYDAGAARLVLNGGELAKTLSEVIGPDVAATMAHAGWGISSEGGEVSGIVISEILEKLAEGMPKDAAA
jgi:3-deoxy-D-manno-octulosonic-acid transferase